MATSSRSSRVDHESSNKKRPIHEIRLGRIRAAIWLNETENGVRHNVTISRLYRDGATWRDSASFGRDDLPLVGKVADLCHTWIFESAAESTAHGRNEVDEPDEETQF